jgi:Skp family chaperone for outer membrane proteins
MSSTKPPDKSSRIEQNAGDGAFQFGKARDVDFDQRRVEVGEGSYVEDKSTKTNIWNVHLWQLLLVLAFSGVFGFSTGASVGNQRLEQELQESKTTATKAQQKLQQLQDAPQQAETKLAEMQKQVEALQQKLDQRQARINELQEENKKLSSLLNAPSNSGTSDQLQSSSISSGGVCSKLPCWTEIGGLKLTVEKVEKLGDKALNIFVTVKNLSGGTLELNNETAGTYLIDDFEAQTTDIDYQYGWASKFLIKGASTTCSIRVNLARANPSTVFVHFKEIVRGSKVVHVMGVPMSLASN